MHANTIASANPNGSTASVTILAIGNAHKQLSSAEDQNHADRKLAKKDEINRPVFFDEKKMDLPVAKTEVAATDGSADTASANRQLASDYPDYPSCYCPIYAPDAVISFKSDDYKCGGPLAKWFVNDLVCEFEAWSSRTWKDGCKYNCDGFLTTDDDGATWNCTGATLIGGYTPWRLDTRSLHTHHKPTVDILLL